MHYLVVFLLLISTAFGLCDATVAQTLTAQWTQKRTPAYYPAGVGPRGWHELAFDSLNRKIMLFGGSGGGGYLNDVWLYDTLTDMWSPLETPTDRCPGWSGFSGPDGRDDQAVEYDPVNHLYWSMGGSGYKCGPLAARTAQAGSSSTTVVDPTLPSDVPDFYKDWTVTANSKQAYVKSYDPATKTLRLASSIAGFAAGTAYRIQVWTDSGTWYYSPATREWRSLEGPHWAYTGSTPFAQQRAGASVAYSSRDRAFVLFGGHSNGNGTNDTWVLDLTTKIWMKKLPDSSTGLPFRRKAILGSMVYDSRNDVFIHFGGLCADPRCPGGEAVVAETWAYHLPTNTWQQMLTPTSPPARMEHRMAYDSEHGVVVLFGGVSVNSVRSWPNQSQRLNDLWLYDYSTNAWTEVTPATSPSPRYLHALEYDPVADRTVMYGGIDGQVWTLQLSLVGEPSNPPPSAIALVTPANGIIGTSFTFDGSRSTDTGGSIVSYHWDFGDGTTAEGVTVAHQFTAAGSFTVTLTVTDNQGATGRALASVIVLPEILIPPRVDITSVKILGIVSDPVITQITVNDTPVSVTGGTFEAPIQIRSASTTVTIRATGPSGTTTRMLTINMP